MEALRHQYPVGALTDALEVSKSGFHAHRRKLQRPRRQRDAALRPLIAASFARSRHTYGPLRVRADLRDLGERCGKNRIGRLMREQAKVGASSSGAWAPIRPIRQAQGRLRSGPCPVAGHVAMNEALNNATLRKWKFALPSQLGK